MQSFHHKFAAIAKRGALVSLLLGAGLMITACQPQNPAADQNAMDMVSGAGGEVVAKVNDTNIYRADVEIWAAAQGLIAEGSTLSAADPQFKTILEELVDQRLLALDATAKSLDQNADARRRLQAAKERILGNIRVEQHLKETVTDASIRRMYEEQSAMANRGQERRARHILVNDEKTAKEVFKQLEDGADFAKLARELSIDPGSAAKGGDLDFFSRDMLDREFTGPIFKADIGDRIPPFKTEFGWHVVEVLDRRVPDQPSFEALRPEIENFMTFDAIQGLLTELREDGEVELLLPSTETEETQDNTQDETE